MNNMDLAFDLDNVNLTTSFETDGEWFLPENKENKLYGRLKYTPSSLTLELNGVFDVGDSKDAGKVPLELDRYPLIYGRTKHGRMTLAKAYLFNPLKGFDVRLATYEATYLIIGIHVGDAPLNSSKALVSCDYLHEFLSIDCFRTISEENDPATNLPSLAIKFFERPPFEYSIASQDTKLLLRQQALFSSGSPEKETGTVTAWSYFTFVPSSPQPFDEWYLPRFWRICRLLTLLTDEIIRPREVLIVPKDDEYVHRLVWSASGIPVDAGARQRPLFNFGHVEKIFDGILDRWFNSGELFTRATAIFVNAIRPTGDPEERLGKLVRAFEAFRQLKRFGGDGLEKHIVSAVATLPPGAVNLICRVPTDFASGVATTRNYHMHHRENLRPYALSGTELFWGCERLAMLLRLLFLNEIGVDMDVAVKRIAEHPRLLNSRFQYMGRPEKMPGDPPRRHRND